LSLSLEVIKEMLTTAESWVEISSQPSSSSLSSIGDEIITTGLRVAQDPHTRRRRRLHPTHPSLQHAHNGTGSSQEEYEESSSESEDHVLSSSNEHIPAPIISRQEYEGSDSEGDDENATALGRRTSSQNTTGEAFTPQPNAFSHPPFSTQNQRPLAPGSYFPHHPTGPRNTYNQNNNTYPSRSSASRQTSYNQADHDAALRASLTTLLSIGAAAGRSLQKRTGQERTTPGTNDPISLRFVPESELLPPAPPGAHSSPSISSEEAAEKKAAGKRKAEAKTSQVKKKKRVLQQISAEERQGLTPGFLGWVSVAGAVVIFTVVGFGAGYVIGREVGRGEMLGPGMGCGREVRDVVRNGSGGGLGRKFRWGIGGMGGRSVVA
jgi:hypothetical protein